jgi:hypothetical protein
MWLLAQFSTGRFSYFAFAHVVCIDVGATHFALYRSAARTMVARKCVRANQATELAALSAGPVQTWAHEARVRRNFEFELVLSASQGA